MIYLPGSSIVKFFINHWTMSDPRKRKTQIDENLWLTDDNVKNFPHKVLISVNHYNKQWMIIHRQSTKNTSMNTFF